jgi:hypothetical protein
MISPSRPRYRPARLRPNRRREHNGEGEGGEDQRSFPTEIWIPIIELKRFDCLIENCQIGGAQKANFVGGISRRCR